MVSSLGHSILAEGMCDGGFLYLFADRKQRKKGIQGEARASELAL